MNHTLLFAEYINISTTKQASLALIQLKCEKHDSFWNHKNLPIHKQQKFIYYSHKRTLCSSSYTWK